ncbi:MAG TPA: YceI family protein [Pararobbsia sp.]|nr:YceI family protein [Pararobbsia sp.]
MSTDAGARTLSQPEPVCRLPDRFDELPDVQMTLSMLSAQLSQLVSATAIASSLSLGSPAFVQADAARSAVSVTIRHGEVPVVGHFTKFDAQVAFDPLEPKRAHAKVSIDVRSFDLGDQEASRRAKDHDWFDTDDYPYASFVSTSIVPAGGDRYSMTGRLTIRGRTQDVVVPVSVSSDGTMRVFDGSLPVHRLRFGIGRSAPASEATEVADEVTMRFRVVVPMRGNVSQ